MAALWFNTAERVTSRYEKNSMSSMPWNMSDMMVMKGPAAGPTSFAVLFISPARIRMGPKKVTKKVDSATPETWRHAPRGDSSTAR